MLSTLKRLKARREDVEGGFTLIELLIVIVVLGILAAVVVFSLGGVTQKADVSACQADGATLSTAIAAFDNLNPGVTATSAALGGSTDGGPYVQSWPSSTHYAYSILKVAVVGPPVISVGTLMLSVNGGAAAPYTGAASCAAVK